MKRAFAAAAALIVLGTVAHLLFRTVQRLGGADGRTELLIIGIDAADWNSIDAMVEEGRLPNFRRLMERGVRADLRSAEPMLTPRLWTTIATGKEPEKHGIKDFYGDTRILRSRRIWDALESAGWSVGLFAWPITWPPREINGFMVPDWMARGPETWPPDLQFLKQMERQARNDEDLGLLGPIAYVARGYRAGLEPGTLARSAGHVISSKLTELDPRESYVALRKLQLRIHTDAFVGLQHRFRPRLAVFYTDVIDKVDHLYWKYHVPEEFPELDPEDVRRFGTVVPDYYELTDWSLGRILDTVDDDTMIVVASDHGFQSDTREKRLRTKIRVPKLLKLLDVQDDLRAFSVTGRLYLRNIDESEEGRALSSRTRERIASFVVDESGASPFVVEEEPDGSFSVVIDREARPTPDGFVRFEGERVPLDQLLEFTQDGGGMHRLMGIFLAICPSCRAGERIPTMDLVDVAPTLLHMIGRPVARDMDGRVIGDVFDSQFMASRPVQWVETYDEGLEFSEEGVVDDAEMEDLLRGIGYVE